MARRPPAPLLGLLALALASAPGALGRGAPWTPGWRGPAGSGTSEPGGPPAAETSASGQSPEARSGAVVTKRGFKTAEEKEALRKKKALERKLFGGTKAGKQSHPDQEEKLRREKQRMPAELRARVNQSVEKAQFKPRPAPRVHKRGKVGFYLHVFSEPKAVLVQMRRVREFYQKAPVYVMSDGGMDCEGACNSIGNCRFVWRNPANDRWNPKPFFRRFRDAVAWLDTEYVIMLEPDVEVVSPIDPRTSFEFDAGGLADNNPPLHGRTIYYIEELGRKTTGDPDYRIQWFHFGLAGGTYVRSDAALDAFDSDLIDWQLAKTLEMTHRVYSSDVAMCFLLAARGYSYYPWKDLTQLRFNRAFYEAGNRTAFRHYGREEIKPYYGEKLADSESGLITAGPANKGQVMCQGCVFTDDDADCVPKPGKEDLSCPVGAHGSFLGLDNFVQAY